MHTAPASLHGSGLPPSLGGIPQLHDEDTAGVAVLGMVGKMTRLRLLDGLAYFNDDHVLSSYAAHGDGPPDRRRPE